ncbi:hypothetical protein [Hyalangium sp.]|uniref:hypothetical protein n=1 Tax=Hyalangium sp. TaxID=2028555 RepID=UPI002D67D3BB|nr:hypothetical protein [Hyalangium sp.]HYH98345.1 hypothetical protein [Hyalangium sp.]
MHAQRGWKGRGLVAALGMLVGGCSQQAAEPAARPASPREAAANAHSAPRITSTFQSELRWFEGNRVTFRVVASDPQARALTITWAANTGSLEAPVAEATQSEVEWTPPPCPLTDTPPAITATVTNAVGVSASATFTLTGATTCLAAGALTKGSRILSMQSESMARNTR